MGLESECFPIRGVRRSQDLKLLFYDHLGEENIKENIWPSGRQGIRRLRTNHVEVKGKAFPLQAWTGPWGSRRLRLPEVLDSRHVKVVRLSALRTGLLYPPGRIPGTHCS